MIVRCLHCGLVQDDGADDNCEVGEWFCDDCGLTMNPQSFDVIDPDDSASVDRQEDSGKLPDTSL